MLDGLLPARHCDHRAGAAANDKQNSTNREAVPWVQCGARQGDSRPCGRDIKDAASRCIPAVLAGSRVEDAKGLVGGGGAWSPAHAAQVVAAVGQAQAQRDEDVAQAGQRAQRRHPPDLLQAGDLHTQRGRNICRERRGHVEPFWRPSFGGTSRRHRMPRLTWLNTSSRAPKISENCHCLVGWLCR